MGLDIQLHSDIWGSFFSDKQAFDAAYGYYLLKKSSQEIPLDCQKAPINITAFNEDFTIFINLEPQLVCSMLSLGSHSKGYLPQPTDSTNDQLWESIQNLEEKVAEFIPLLDKSIQSRQWHKASTLDQILDLHLSHTSQYHDIRRIYWYLYCELKLTLRLFAARHLDAFNMALGKNFEMWIKLRKQDLPVLSELARALTPRDQKGLLKIEKDLRALILKKHYSVEGISGNQNSINEIEVNLKTQFKPKELSERQITLIPKNPEKRKHQNQVIVNDADPIIVQNSPFDFLYWIAWCDQNNKSQLNAREELPQEYRDQILINCSERITGSRFKASWTRLNNPNKKWNAQSEINALFDFDVIGSSDGIFSISTEYKIALRPFPFK